MSASPIATTDTVDDAVHRFIFEHLDIRGALVQLGPAWQAMQARRNYVAPVRELLGELAAVAAIIGSNLKTPGRITFQLQGHGPVAMLVMDCDQQLRMRGMARLRPDIQNDAATALVATGIHELLGDGQLALNLQTEQGSPYQSIVPLEGDKVGTVFEHYLTQSEQLPARLWLVANEHTACGLFLQKLPDAEARDHDGWARIETLAATVRDDELTLAPTDLLGRLFANEEVRLFSPRPVTWHCPRDEAKVRDMLISLGQDELRAMLADAEQISVDDEICGHEYRFGRELLDELFPPAGRVLH